MREKKLQSVKYNNIFKAVELVTKLVLQLFYKVVNLIYRKKIEIRGFFIV